MFLDCGGVFVCLLLSSSLRTATNPNLGANKNPQLHHDSITEMLLPRTTSSCCKQGTFFVAILNSTHSPKIAALIRSAYDSKTTLHKKTNQSCTLSASALFVRIVCVCTFCLSCLACGFCVALKACRLPQTRTLICSKIRFQAFPECRCFACSTLCAKRSRLRSAMFFSTEITCCWFFVFHTC